MKLSSCFGLSRCRHFPASPLNKRLRESGEQASASLMDEARSAACAILLLAPGQFPRVVCPTANRRLPAPPAGHSPAGGPWREASVPPHLRGQSPVSYPDRATCPLAWRSSRAIPNRFCSIRRMIARLLTAASCSSRNGLPRAHLHLPGCVRAAQKQTALIDVNQLRARPGRGCAEPQNVRANRRQPASGRFACQAPCTGTESVIGIPSRSSRTACR